MAMSKTFYWSVVEVVEATTMDFSCAIAGPAKKGAKYRDEGEYGISQ